MIKRKLPLLTPKIGLERVSEYYKEENEHNSFFSKGVLYHDIDKCLVNLIKNDFKLIDNYNTKEVIPVTLFNIQRWTEFYSTWDNVDKNKNIQLPFISIVRLTDPQPGTARGTTKNIAGNRHYFYYKLPTNDGVRDGFDIYKIPQPLPVDIKYDIKIFSFNIELLNDFNLIFQKKYKSGDLYIKPNGIWMSTKIDNPSDNSNLGSINQRKYYSQTITLTVKGWIIDPNDFIIEKGINRVVSDVNIALENKNNISVLELPIDNSSFTISLTSTNKHIVNTFQYKNQHRISINSVLVNSNVNKYEIYNYGTKIFDSVTSVLPLIIDSNDKIIFTVTKNDIVGDVKLDLVCSIV
jgi:hypothetical protein